MLLRNLLERRALKRRWAGKGGPNPQGAAAFEEIARQPQKQGPLLCFEFDDARNVLPPWKAFPDYARSSMGWRMGGSEDYWIKFAKWYHTLNHSSRSVYRKAYQAPIGWEDYYEMIESK